MLHIAPYYNKFGPLIFLELSNSNVTGCTAILMVIIMIMVITVRYLF